MLQSRKTSSKTSILLDESNSNVGLEPSSEVIEKTALDINETEDDMPIWEKKLSKLEKNKK